MSVEDDSSGSSSSHGSSHSSSVDALTSKMQRQASSTVVSVYLFISVVMPKDATNRRGGFSFLS